MRAVAYLRFAETMAAAEPHRLAIETWAKRACVEISSWHVDVGVDATTPIAERPALVAAYRAIREYGANILVAANAEQFSHDELVSWLIEQAALTERAALQTADGSRLHVGALPQTPPHPRGEAPLPSDGARDAPEEVGYARGAVDLARAYDRVIVRARVRASLAEKRARGERIGNVPFGYRLSTDGLHTEPDAAEQAVVSAVRSLSEQGLSQRAIVIQLAERGVAGRTGAPLGQTQVARILRSA